MIFGKAISMFNRVAPKISRGIGQVSEIGRNIGQVVKHGRNIGSIANQMSGGRLSQSPIGQKIQDAAIILLVMKTMHNKHYQIFQEK